MAAEPAYPLWARRSDAFVKLNRVVVPVSTLATVLFAALNIRGYASAIIFVDNDGTDTFNGQIEFSPNGVYPGTIEPNDAFVAMAPGGPTRWYRVPSDAQWFRVTGTFPTTPGDVRVSVMLQRGA